MSRPVCVPLPGVCRTRLSLVPNRNPRSTFIHADAVGDVRPLFPPPLCARLRATWPGQFRGRGYRNLQFTSLHLTPPAVGNKPKFRMSPYCDSPLLGFPFRLPLPSHSSLSPSFYSQLITLDSSVAIDLSCCPVACRSTASSNNLSAVDTRFPRNFFTCS